MLRSPSRKRTKKAPEQEQLHPNLDTEQPLVFISHDHRDSELAEAFQNLIADASAGVVRCFRSSDRLGTSGIEYGSVWYQAVMEHLDDASAVVALLTTNSTDRPWILYEVGVAKGKLGTTVFGLVLGLPLDAASKGPFAQFQNSGSDEDSLMKLVTQLVTPYARPRDEVLRGFVRTFIEEVSGTLAKRTGNPQEASIQGDDNSAAKLFEEIKLLVGDIPRIALMLDRLLSARPTEAVAGPSLGRDRLTRTINIGGASHTLRFSGTWSDALHRLGWPDGPRAVKLMDDVEKWFSEEPSRLTSQRSGQVGDVNFLILPRRDGTTLLSQFRQRK